MTATLLSGYAKTASRWFGRDLIKTFGRKLVIDRRLVGGAKLSAGCGDRPGECVNAEAGDRSGIGLGQARDYAQSGSSRRLRSPRARRPPR